MKKTIRILCLVLLIAMAAVALVSCSQYGSLQKAFEKEGYKVNETLEGAAEEVKKSLEKEELAVTLHLMSKDLTSVLIIEFQATDDLKEAYKNNDTVKGMVSDVTSNEDAQAAYDALVKAGYAKGNCLVLPLSILHVDDITTIVKNA